jgi:BMFP domain-containing protein YqiC
LETKALSYEDFIGFSEEILDLVTNTVEAALAHVMKTIRGNILSTHVDDQIKIIQADTEKNIKRVLDTTLRVQLDELYEKYTQGIADLERHKDAWNHVVLYRNSDGGVLSFIVGMFKPMGPTDAYYIYDKMKEIYRNADYEQTQQELFEVLEDTTRRIDEMLAEIDAKVIAEYESLFKIFFGMIEDAKNLRKNIDTDTQFFDVIFDRASNIIQEKTQLSANLPLSNSTVVIRKDFTSLILKVMTDIKKSLLGLGEEIEKLYIQNGSYVSISNFININEFKTGYEEKFSTDVKLESLHDEIAGSLNTKINLFGYAVKTKKNGPATQPGNNIELSTEYMRDELLESRGGDKTVLLLKIKELYENYNEKADTMGKETNDTLSRFGDAETPYKGENTVNGYLKNAEGVFEKNAALCKKIEKILNEG